jgi:hypothetical protein
VWRSARSICKTVQRFWKASNYVKNLNG